MTAQMPVAPGFLGLFYREGNIHDSGDFPLPTLPLHESERRAFRRLPARREIDIGRVLRGLSGER